MTLLADEHIATEMDESIEDRVVSVVRQLARELGGDRAAGAVTPTASLERELGLGSLERVELLTRLEAELGREFDDHFLLLDSPREIARESLRAPVEVRAPRRPVTAQPPAAPLALDDVTTLVEALRRRAAREPARVHVELNTNGEIRRLTYAELWDGAKRIAGSLRARGIDRGEPVAIMLPTSVEYLQSFMGVLAAGGIAVPLYPPARLDRLVEYLTREARIMANADARVLIAMPEALPITRMLKRDAPSLETIVTADVLRQGEPVDDHAVDGGDAALVQYTSGSTGDPKGVLLTHANLLANIRAIAEGVQLTPADAAVSWLPLYHDMGLIGIWLNMMVNGIPLTLMSPLTFLARPERWLWAIHEQRATLSPAPNFAYELCVRKIGDEALAGLDLSSWRCASNGSEPVSAATLERFTERFAPYGFRREALFPVYGLAECAVALCFPPVGRAPLVDGVAREIFTREGRAVQCGAGEEAPLRFVSVGSPLRGHEVRLVDERGTDVPERVVGRLIFRGPSCMARYHRNPEATARTVSADGWIDSGDRAYRANGELFITGRVKDLIIKAGRNLVPQEIEEVVGAIPGIRKGCVAAFGVPDEASGTERLVVLAESRITLEDERSRLARAAVAAVAAGVGVPPDAVYVVPPGSVPKTSSGKIRRSAAREAFEAGRLGAQPLPPLRVRARLALGAMRRVAVAGARHAARALQIALLVALWTLALLLLGPVVALLAWLLPAGRPVRRLSRFIGRAAMLLSGTRVRVEGAEHLPPRAAAVLVTNHTSYADTPVLLASLPVDFLFVAMKEILSWPLIGFLARRGDHVMVDRWHMRESVADAAAAEARLRAGAAVLFFAEGGFSRARGLRPFRLGAFEAAVATGAPVIPIALSGSRERLPADTRVPHPGRVRLWIGEPIRPAGRDWSAVLDLRERAAAAVAAHCGEPRLHAAIAPSMRRQD